MLNILVYDIDHYFKKICFATCTKPFYMNAHNDLLQMNRIPENVEDANDLVDAALNFWLKGNGPIRSPFPSYIHKKIQKEPRERFLDWLNNLDSKTKKQLSDELLVEKFELILFEISLGLVKTEDEKITIKYPFLPRTNDPVQTTVKNHNKSRKVRGTIIERELIKEKNQPYLKVKCLDNESEYTWETKFKLPE